MNTEITFEIIKGNSTIARFMGAVYDKEQDIFIYPEDSTPTEGASTHWNAWAMEYNTSWDWIMPAVKRWLDLFHQLKDDMSKEQFRQMTHLEIALSNADIHWVYKYLVILLNLYKS